MRLVALKLSKAGYFQGNPESVLQGRVDIVLELIHYEKFLQDYEEIFYDINKDK